ncbi:MAG: methyl-accepting chemotaxis protein [Candidatus Marinimicrobia bacterium]|nr:methyl-accepting chemotaxis protein [Candidatus Neomarinimicrobiota bacterium]
MTVTETFNGGSGKREVVFAGYGILLGVMAPLGWIILRLMLFWDDSSSLLDQVFQDIMGTEQNSYMYAYMCGGTMLVLGSFGFFIGRSSQQIHDRAVKLDHLNKEIAEQKSTFERRFTDLGHSIKNFHTINADLQKSIDRQDILRLTADGLHEVIGFDRVNVLMVDETEKQLYFAGNREANLSRDGVKRKLPLDERAGCLYKSINDRQVMLIDDITKMPEEYHLLPPCDAVPQLRSRNFILCPIIVRNQSIGLLAVDNKYKRGKLTDTDVDTVKLFADQISSSLMRINLLDAVESLTKQLEHTFNEFLKYRDEHAELITSLRMATASTTSATADISGGAGVIQESVNSTRSAVGQISVSIDQVSNNLKTLNEFMEGSIASMTEIQYTVGAVEENSVRSHAMSETVKERAEYGVETVGQVLDGMRGIVAAVEQAEGVITNLSTKGDEVGTITSVVTDLTRKTSLLALNAAIIASQAGEHGRSFAVVADEIRTLAQEAAASTDQINQIIEEIQKYTRETVDHIHSKHQLVNDGMKQGEEMADVLSQILGSSQEAMEMAHDIRKSTQEISLSVIGVNKSVEELGEMSSQVTKASREEAGGAKNIVAAVEEIRSMTEDMVFATASQAENTSQIEISVNRVSDMAQRIFDEMDDRRKGSLQVIEDLRRLKEKKD